MSSLRLGRSLVSSGRRLTHSIASRGGGTRGGMERAEGSREHPFEDGYEQALLGLFKAFDSIPHGSSVREAIALG